MAATTTVSGGMHHRGNRCNASSSVVTNETAAPKAHHRKRRRDSAHTKNAKAMNACSAVFVLSVTAIVAFTVSFYVACLVSVVFSSKASLSAKMTAERHHQHTDNKSPNAATSSSEQGVHAVVAGAISMDAVVAQGADEARARDKPLSFGDGAAAQNHEGRLQNLARIVGRRKQQVHFREREMLFQQLQAAEGQDPGEIGLQDPARASLRHLQQRRQKRSNELAERFLQKNRFDPFNNPDSQLDMPQSLSLRQPRFLAPPDGKWIEPPEPRGELVRLDTMSNNNTDHSVNNTIVPLVIMVYKRVEYLFQVMDSIRASDIPIPHVPIVISHDGRVPDVVEYVDSLKDEFQIIQLFHPYSCYEHPNSFPGNDTSLNIGYSGDTYGHLRSGWATCCKHHFTWMINQVFNHERLQAYDTFYFGEEDYIVSKRFYSSLCTGLNVMAKVEQQETINGFFGLTFDMSNGAKKFKPEYILPNGTFMWTIRSFKTGPVAINRNAWDMVRNHSKDYCSSYDDYNWDWTLHMLMLDNFLPKSTLAPYRVPLVQHIGEKGMHTSEHISLRILRRRGGIAALKKRFGDFNKFLEADVRPSTTIQKTRFSGKRNQPHKPSGGWNHPKDHEHCEAQFV